MSKPVIITPTELQLKLLRALAPAPMTMKEYLAWAKEQGIEHRLDFMKKLVDKQQVEPINVPGEGVVFQLIF